MAIIRGFRDLDVYKFALKEAGRIFVFTRRFPVEERYSLTSQIRRSSRAVTRMIAEAWARRQYQAAFISKVNEALGEAMETQAWLDHALACEYITASQHREHDAAWQQIGGKLARMIDRADSFCGSAPRQRLFRHPPSSTLHPLPSSRGCGGLFVYRESLRLKAKRQKNMPQAVHGETLQEIGGEIDGEIGAEGLDIGDQEVPVQGGHEPDQFFNLLCVQHHQLHLIRPARSVEVRIALNLK